MIRRSYHWISNGAIERDHRTGTDGLHQAILHEMCRIKERYRAESLAVIKEAGRHQHMLYYSGRARSLKTDSYPWQLRCGGDA